tara:strand:+ start:4236 stop:5951 length:1716 start_codon:yes stop_codon:yes gene_type:complete
MKFNSKYLDQIIKEEIENVLLESDGAPVYDKEMYFKSNPGLREKWTKAYSDPRRAARMNAHDKKTLAFNKKNIDAIRAGKIKARMTTVQQMGNKAIADWYHSTSSEDRAMKTRTGAPSARAKFYDKMRAMSRAKGEEVDIAGMDADDVFTQEPAGWRWTDPLGLSGQRQFKFQKDIIDGDEVSPEKLADRADDFEGWHAGDLGISPEWAGHIEDIVTTFAPTSIHPGEIALSILPGGKAAKGVVKGVGKTLKGVQRIPGVKSTMKGIKKTKDAAKAGLEKLSKNARLERKLTNDLVKQGVPKQFAQQKAREHIIKMSQKKAEKAGIKFGDKIKRKATPGLGPDDVTKVMPKVKDPLRDRIIKQLKVKPGRGKAALRQLKNKLGKIEGFKLDPMTKGLSVGGFIKNRITGKGLLGAKTSYALSVAYRALGKNETTDREILSVVREYAGKIGVDLPGTDRDVRRFMKNAHDDFKRENTKYYKLDNELKSNKGSVDQQSRNQDRIIDDLELEEDTEINVNELKRYFNSLHKRHGRAGVGDWKSFLEKLKKRGYKVEDLELKENIVNLVMEKLGY